MGLFRWLSPPSGLSLTAAATLATLERSGPCRLTSLAIREGVTQPAMTQLIARLQGDGLVTRDPDPADGRVVRVGITDKGSAVLSRRRAVRADRPSRLGAKRTLIAGLALIVVSSALAGASPTIGGIIGFRAGMPAATS